MYTYICIYIISRVPRAWHLCKRTYVYTYIYAYSRASRWQWMCANQVAPRWFFSMSCYVCLYTYYAGRPGFIRAWDRCTEFLDNSGVGLHFEGKRGGRRNELINFNARANTACTRITVCCSTDSNVYTNVRCWKLKRSIELSLRKKSTSDWPKSPWLCKTARWGRRARDVRSVVCCTDRTNVRLTVRCNCVLCLVGTFATETDRHAAARAAKYNRRHERSHAFAIQFKMRSETRCRASGLLDEQTRDSKPNIRAHAHIHMHTRACLCLVDCKCKRLYLEFVNVRWVWVERFLCQDE